MAVAEWIVGITCVLVGCFFSATGMVLMKSSAQVEARLPWHRRHRWFIGCFSLIVNATIMETIALALAPLSLLAPFAGCTIVFSTLLARCGALSDQESVHETRWAAIIVTLVGVTVVSIYGPHQGAEVNEDNVYFLLTSLGFELFAGLSTAAIVAVCVLWCAEPATVRKGRHIVPLLAYAAASCGALSLNFLKVLALAMRSAAEPSAEPRERNELLAPHCGLALLALASYAPLQLALLNTALVHSPVSFAVPMYESLLIVLSIVAGGTFYREFDGMSAAATYGFGAGVLVTVCGLALLALSHAPPERLQSPAATALSAGGEIDDGADSDGRMTDALEAFEAEVGRAAAAVLGYEKQFSPHHHHHHHPPPQRHSSHSTQTDDRLSANGGSPGPRGSGRYAAPASALPRNVSDASAVSLDGYVRLDR
jgi:hypothetical protein